jgi:hypothetical protein
MTDGMDPSGANRLDRIETKIDAILQGLDRLYQEGGARLSGIEDEGSDRLDHIEKLLETINMRLAAKP